MTFLRRAALAALLLCTGCVLTVENGQIRRPDFGGDPIGSGRDLYTSRCASCHGLGARGDGPVGGALRVAPPDLTWLADRNGGEFPREYVIAVITGNVVVPAHGTREMPVWSDRFATTEGSGGSTGAALYARRTVEAIADYLASIQRRLSAAAPGR
jgi:mono/diheme cytochrome c family protein